MDESTLNNIKLLEHLGYFYDKRSNKFWAMDHDLYIDLPFMHCNDLVRAMNMIIEFEKNLAFEKGKNSVQKQINNSQE